MKTVLVLIGVLATAPARLAAAKTPAHDEVTQRRGPPSGLAIGVEVGEPSAVTLRYALGGGRFGVQVGVGSGVVGGTGLAVHGDLTVGVVRLGQRSLLFAGVGARYYRHHYPLASVDELSDTHTGVRVPVGVTAPIGGLELYLQVAPGYDLARSQSCNLASGVNSLCPHAASSRLFVHANLGARFYF